MRRLRASSLAVAIGLVALAAFDAAAATGAAGPPITGSIRACVRIDGNVVKDRGTVRIIQVSRRPASTVARRGQEVFR